MNTKTNSLKQQLLEARQKSRALFSDISHRLESFTILNDVEWINDSKATDLDSTYYSLELMQKPVVWIVGTSEAENDYSIFDRIVKYKVRNIICFGDHETSIKYKFSGMVEGYAHKKTIEEAVEIAQRFAQKGDVVLFSPACASYPNFEDFRERGDAFKTVVNNLG